jgi:hypothetical protein
MTPRGRVLTCVFSTGVAWADRERERDGDYVRLAFLPFDTLELKVAPDCPEHLKAGIQREAAAVQARRGQEYQISTSGQTVRLGQERRI